jgi:hypothetical protein
MEFLHAFVVQRQEADERAASKTFCSVELSLLLDIASGIHSAIFSSFTASLTCISLLLESLSFPLHSLVA